MLFKTKDFRDTGNAEYLESLWWNMHHSDNSDRLSLAVSCYVDESGTDSLNPDAVVAGVVFNKQNFLSFDRQWARLLSRHSIKPPLHMIRLPDKLSRNGSRHQANRLKFFSEAVEIINDYKNHSVAATLNKQDYNENTPDLDAEKTKKSIYGWCFILLANLNHRAAENKKYDANIAYVFDNGIPHKINIFAARDLMLNWQKSKPLHMGSLTFDSYDNVSALQAADMVAWGARRRVSNIPIDKGFEPINDLLDKYHIQKAFQVKDLPKAINKIKKPITAL